MNRKAYYDRPLAFFIAVMSITWIPWLAAAASGLNVDSILMKVLIAAGGTGPMLSALIIVYSSQNKALRKDYWRRIFKISLIRPTGYLFILLFFPITALISVTISTIFGQSFHQFQLIESLQENILGIFPFMLFILFFGPVPEELGWRGYWLDSLRTKFNGLNASLILGAVWALWHLPLFFIKGYPLADLTGNPLRMTAYFIDLLPKAILFTYVFFTNKRSTMAAILFHFMANFTGSIVEIATITELIQLILLSIAAVVVVLKNRLIYCSRNKAKIPGVERIE